MPLVMKENIALDPLNISLFCAQTKMADATDGAHVFKEPRLCRCMGGRWLHEASGIYSTSAGIKRANQLSFSLFTRGTRSPSLLLSNLTVTSVTDESYIRAEMSGAGAPKLRLSGSHAHAKKDLFTYVSARC